MKTIFPRFILFTGVLGFLFTSGCTTPSYESVLISNVTIIDGTGEDRYLGSVRISEGRITGTGRLKPLATDSVIDATGLILSPGFIDTHSHHERDTNRTVDAAISQGITTIIVGQDGGSILPLSEYFDSLARYPLSLNLGSYAGHGRIRSEVMGRDFKRLASRGEIDSMRSVFVSEMESGALGLSTGLEYDPGIYSSTEEVIELAKIAAEMNGKYISHMRSEDVRLEQSIEEILKIGKEAEIPVQISHFKLGRRSLWGQAENILSLLDSAREAGIDVTADIYPYEYWQSTMTVLFPERDFDNFEQAVFALTELTSPEGMIISRFNADPTYEGKTLAEIAELRNEEPAETYLNLISLSREIRGESIIAKSMDEEDIKEILRWPHSNLCSDGSPYSHPRGWGSFPRYLAMDSGQSLEEKIRKITSLGAEHVGLDSLGIIKVGYPADLVLFDPKDVQDKATYEEHSLRSEGIELVFVSGTIVYADQNPTGRFTGRVLKLK